MRIKKIDSQTNQGIYNVEFMVFDENRNQVGTYYSDNNGVVDVKTEYDGRYTIRETKEANGYLRVNMLTPNIARELLFSSSVLAFAKIDNKEIIDLSIVSLPDKNSLNLSSRLILLGGDEDFLVESLKNFLDILSELELSKIKIVVDNARYRNIVNNVKLLDFKKEVDYIHNEKNIMVYSKIIGD